MLTVIGGGNESNQLVSPPVQTPQLNINELYQKRVNKDTARLKTYNEILQRIYHRIRTISQMPNSPANIVYTVPQFIIGLPRIDLEDCIIYIVHQLRMNMFVVRYTYPNLLYISWEHHEKDYITGQSPIMLAMLEADQIARERAKRQQAFLQKSKKQHSAHISATASASISPLGIGSSLPAPSASHKKSVRFAPSISQQGIPHPPNISPSSHIYNDPLAPSVGHIPSASEYIPPTNFLRTMTTSASSTSSLTGGGTSATKIQFTPTQATSTSSVSNILMDLWK